MADMRVPRARRLRREPTFAESRLWDLLRGRAFEDLKFRRQVPIGPYIADFLCKAHRLVIELDGGIHDAPFYDRERQEQRDAWLREQGLTVLRFSNGDVIDRPNLILDAIRNHTNLPSPLGEKGWG